MIRTPELAAVAKPTETPPAPDTDRLPSVPTAEDEADVVFPSAAIELAVPDAIGGATDSIRTQEFAAVENPAEMPPVAETDRLPSVPTADDDCPKVLPRAASLLAVPDAAGVAPDITRIPWPAAVVEYPTDTPPAPENES